ncbi:MAG: serine/threonine protein kinase [Acidobacteria bacterium]|nr:serine/threonine protein kinase [Acidobacteriota bacterium]
MKKIGRYEVVEELGRGAMGVVYKASDPTIGRMVAIKVLVLDDKVEEGTLSPRETFLREARAAGRLSHPGIVTIHDALEDEPTRSSYIVMEYIPGRTLEKLLISSPQIGAEKAFDIIRQVAESLDYAHRNQIIHRDLKPANIILTEDGRAKITDFGIAKIAAQGAMRTVAIMGTPSYMSPEQVTGGEIDARADIFSMGILLYLMLVGEKPFVGDTAAVMFKIVYEDPVLPSKVNPKLTAADDYVILRCLAKDRAKRYGSAREFLEDLDDLRRARPPRSQARVLPSEIHAAERTVAAAHPLIRLRPPSAAPTAPVAPPAALASPLPTEPILPVAPPPVAAPPTGIEPTAALPLNAPAASSPAVPPAPAPTEVKPPSATAAAPVAETAVVPAAVLPAGKKSPAPIYAVIGLVAVVAIGAGIWYSRQSAAPENAAPPPSPQPAAPAPPPAPAAESGRPDIAPKSNTATPSPKPITKKPEAGAKSSTQPSVPAQASAQTAPTPVAAAQPAPAPAMPATSTNAITVYCKHEFEQATLLMTENGKTVYQARLLGKKKKGFIGIGGKGFSGVLTETASIPFSSHQLTVRVYSDDGTVNLQNKVAAHPPSTEATMLRVIPSKDHLALEWAKANK